MLARRAHARIWTQLIERMRRPLNHSTWWSLAAIYGFDAVTLPSRVIWNSLAVPLASKAGRVEWRSFTELNVVRIVASPASGYPAHDRLHYDLITEDEKKQKYTKIKEMIFSVVEDFEIEAAKTAKIFSGIPETLKTLRDMKLKIGLCTICSEKTTDYVLKRFNLEQFFDAVIARESVFEVKPHPTHLEAALNALKVSSQEAVLVGDSVKDIKCAVQLNVLAVGVTTGLSSMEELSCAGAHYIASSANEIPILIRQLNKRKVHPSL